MYTHEDGFHSKLSKMEKSLNRFGESDACHNSLGPIVPLNLLFRLTCDARCALNRFNVKYCK